MLARVMELHQLARAGGGQAPGGMLAMWDIPDNNYNIYPYVHLIN